MFLSPEELASLETQYGRPHQMTARFEASAEEFDGIRNSQKHGRNHDFTLYIFKGDQVIVNAKHFYPKGLYRAPSGGVQPGERIVDGIAREALEETGTEIELRQFLLKTDVTFACGDESLLWRSFVFRAEWVSGDFEFTDQDEIREVTVVPLEAFEEFSKTMRATNRAGFHYRAALHDEVKRLLLSQG